MNEHLKIWMNGRPVPWRDANVHLMTQAMHYGSSVFEGMWAYESHRGTVIFRLRDHIERLFYSAGVFRINIPIGKCSRGPLTERLQDLFFGLFDGTTEDKWGWLETVEEGNETAIAV